MGGAIPKCGATNKAFIASLQDALKSDPHCQIDTALGRITGYSARPVEGLTKFAGIYFQWIIGESFFRTLKRWLPGSVWANVEKGFIDSFLQNWDAMEYYVVSETWCHGDVSANSKHNGDLKAALGSIQARVFLLPGSTDQYFLASEIQEEAKMIPKCVYKPIVSRFGHICEMIPWNQKSVNEAIRQCLNP